MRALLIVFISVIIMNKALSSDCKTISKDLEYHSSDYVFLGEVLDTYNTHFDVKVNEVFKGVMGETLRVTIDDNSVFPKQGETWLFYSRKNVNDNYISRCGWSRSFSRPFSANSETFPEPPPLGISDALLIFLNKFNIEMALSELRYDIISLRQMKTQQEIAVIKKANIKIKEDNKTISSQLTFLKWGSIVLILLIIILCIKNFMK